MNNAREDDGANDRRQQLGVILERLEDLVGNIAAVTADLANAASSAPTEDRVAFREASLHLMRAMLAVRPHLSTARDLLQA